MSSRSSPTPNAASSISGRAVPAPPRVACGAQAEASATITASAPAARVKRDDRWITRPSSGSFAGEEARDRLDRQEGDVERNREQVERYLCGRNERGVGDGARDREQVVGGVDLFLGWRPRLVGRLQPAGPLCVVRQRRRRRG